MTTPPLPRPSEPTCRKCGHPASDSVHGLFSGGCLETEAGIYRHALTEMQAENDQLRQDRYDALSVTSRDGLLSSEWVARTGKAERERDTAITAGLVLIAERDRAQAEASAFFGAHAPLVAERDALRAENAKLREIAEKVATHEWIIGSAYRERPTSEFGWQVNVRDGEPDERGSQHYKALRETFALHPADAGLNALPDSRGK